MDKIVCLGKNYLDHAQELGDAVPEKPVLFIKPPSVLRAANRPADRLQLRLPTGVSEVHYECEIVLRLKQDCYCVTPEQAEKAIGEISLGLDMTLRDVQTRLKGAGHPWELGKTFIDSAIVGPMIPLKDLPKYLDEPFMLKLDGEIRQQAMGNQNENEAERLHFLRQPALSAPLGRSNFYGNSGWRGSGPVRAIHRSFLGWAGALLGGLGALLVVRVAVTMGVPMVMRMVVIVSAV